MKKIRISLTTKLIALILLMVLPLIVIASYFFIRNFNKVMIFAKQNFQVITDIAVNESTEALNNQAEKYLKNIAKQTIDVIASYIEQRKEDLIILANSEKSEKFFLRFSRNREAIIHNRDSQAPVEGISFPNEEDLDDVELVPIYKRLVYVDETGEEKVKIENNAIRTNYNNVSDTLYFQETKKLPAGQIYILTKKYKIWDCTERTSSLIGEPIYKNQDQCPDKAVMALDVANWQRFTDGYIRYATPVFEQDQFKGVIVVDVDFLPIMKIVNDVKVAQAGYAYLDQSMVGTKEYEQGEGITIAHPSHQFVLNMDPATLYKLGSPGLDDLRALSQKQHQGELGIGRYIFREIDKYTAYAGFREGEIIWSIGLTNPVVEFITPAKVMEEKIKEAANKANKGIILTAQSCIFNFFLFIIILLLAEFLLIIIFSRRFIRPIKKLTDYAAEIGKGNLEIKIKIKSKDEVGKLANAFSRMAQDLKKSKNELEKYSQDLERQISKRTKELVVKVEELEKFQELTVGRELKMIDLKKKIKEIEEKFKNSNK